MIPNYHGIYRSTLIFRVSWACKQFSYLISRWHVVLCLLQSPRLLRWYNLSSPSIASSPVQSDLQNEVLWTYWTNWRWHFSSDACYLMFFGLLNGKWPFMPAYMLIFYKSVRRKNGVCNSICYTFYFIIPSKILVYKMFLRKTLRAHSPSFLKIPNNHCEKCSITTDNTFSKKYCIMFWDEGCVCREREMCVYVCLMRIKSIVLFALVFFLFFFCFFCRRAQASLLYLYTFALVSCQCKKDSSYFQINS